MVSEASLVCALDSNVILRYILRDHPTLSPAAQTVLQGVSTGERRVFCDPVIVAEVVYVLTSVYGLSREMIGDALLDLLRSPGLLVPDKNRYLKALTLFTANVPHFCDACACALALEKCDGRLYSFDKKLSSIPEVTRLEHPPKNN